MMRLRQDRDIQVAMGNLLRSGVILAFTVVLTGAVIYLFRHGSEHPAYHHFQAGMSRFHTFSAIMEGALAGRGRAIIQLGIVILILTPITRIAFSIAGFLLEKDYLYAFITAVVLAIIIVSLYNGVNT